MKLYITINKPQSRILWAYVIDGYDYLSITPEDFSQFIYLYRMNSIQKGKLYDITLRHFISLDRDFRNILLNWNDSDTIEYAIHRHDGTIEYEPFEISEIMDMLIDIIHSPEDISDYNTLEFIRKMIQSGKLEIESAQKDILADL